MPRTPNETIQSQFRLEPQTLAELDRIAEWLGNASRTAAVRFAAHATAELVDGWDKIASKKNPKKSRKTA